MSIVQPSGRPAVQIDLANADEHRRQMARAINRISQGHINSTLFVTLTPNATQTVVTDSRIAPQTCVTMQPQTADAAAALAGLYIVCGQGGLTIYHASNAATDQLFTMGMVG